MKKYLGIDLFVIFLSFSFLNAQSVSEPRKLFTENLDAYVGTWEYKNPNIVFRVFLRKGIKVTDRSFGECLVGDYFYQLNGVVLDAYDESKVPAELNVRNWQRVVVLASNGGFRREYINANELYMFLTDKRLKKRSMSCKITLLSPTQIRWYVENDEGPVDMDFIHEFSIPTDLVLTKVK